jgi:hypothetical protein
MRAWSTSAPMCCLLLLPGISYTAVEGWELSSRIQSRSVMVCTDAERGCCAKGQRPVSINDV